ncbi:E3 ubiquitin-protein ligase TRIM56-like [Ostrea edulis]|uniref:E3 ubiquitin-protein ligase TRIM56-like n=1 Tax=Ostrea edulis TaxID=37623 RepID=UPI0024AEFA94|nr:E3 ubiquitin-protein ligase TRIM56-like [Ostrea edulis]
MATGVVGELKEDFLECPICTEEYDEDKHIPRILPCQHSFCSECLSKETRIGKLTCSMCKRNYKVKEKGIEHFPKDLTRRNLKDILSRIASKSCSICKKMESVKFECMSCDVKLCRRCYKARKSTDCKNHSVKELHEVEDQTPDTSLDSFEIKAENICNLPGHEKNSLKFYCMRQGCRVPICANCATKGHKQHEWEELDEIYSTQKEQFLARLTVAKKNIHSAKEVLLFCRNENETMKEKARKGMEAINREKEIGINFINQETEELSLTNIRTVKEFTDKFERKESLLQSFIENAQECCSISEKLLKENKTSFLSLEKAISDKLEIFGTKTFHQEKLDIDEESLLLREECGCLKNRIKRMMDPFQENSTFQFQITSAGRNERGNSFGKSFGLAN